MISFHYFIISLFHYKRVVQLLEELNVSYNLVRHDRGSQTNLALQSLKDIHPLGKAPVIIEGDIILCESSTIMEYILDKETSEKLRPKNNTASYYQYLEWSHFAEGSLSLPLISKLFMGMEQRDGQQPLDAYIKKEITVDFAYIENTLGTQEYFAGSIFTAADIMMTIPLEIAGHIGLLQDTPNISAYLKRIQQREAYIKAISFD